MALSFKQRVFPYLVVASGCALCFAPITLSFGCAGIFYTPVSESLGVGKGAFALYMTFFYLAQTIALPIFGSIMERYDARVVLTCAALAMGVPLLAMSRFDSLWQFYLAGAIMGIGDAPICYLAIPTLITRWFSRRVGFFVGMCMAFTGLGGVIFNPVGGMFIATGPEGWRLGYLVFGIISLAVSLPFTLFCLRSRPSDIGIAPVGSSEWRLQSVDGVEPGSEGVGENEGEREGHDQVEKPVQEIWYGGVTAREAFRLPSFYAMLGFAFLMTSLMMFYLFFPSYASSLGDEHPHVAALSATIAAAVMAGQAVGKLVLGPVGDRSALVGLGVMGSCGLAGLLLMWLVPGVAPLFLLAGFLFGILYAGETVQMPLMARTIFGTREYSSIYSRVTTASSLGGTIFTSAWGFIIEGVDYGVAFALAVGILLVLLGLGTFALRHKPAF